jgi:regulator of cell morphogenesis and NO signaling
MELQDEPLNSETTVAQLVFSRPEALAVLTKYNIDYCCGGKRSVGEACRTIGLDPQTLWQEINRSLAGPSGYSLRPHEWNSSLLVDFIVENHHGFVRKAIPELNALLERVCERHGAEHSYLLEIKSLFNELSEELIQHMNKEELALFPAVKRLAVMANNSPLIRIIQEPIEAMEDDHQLAGALIRQIRSLSDNYTPPAGACVTFQMTFQKLREFEADLMIHVHLENHVLFPRFT